MRTSSKNIRSAEYQKAEEYVRSIYETHCPPYSEQRQSEIMEEVERLAPNVNLDQEWLERTLERLFKQNPEIHAVTRTEQEWSLWDCRQVL